MGFFSRLPVPRGMRRAAHPEHVVTPAAAPEAVEVANGRDLAVAQLPHPRGVEELARLGRRLGLVVEALEDPVDARDPRPVRRVLVGQRVGIVSFPNI